MMEHISLLIVLTRTDYLIIVAHVGFAQLWHVQVWFSSGTCKLVVTEISQHISFTQLTLAL